MLKHFRGVNLEFHSKCNRKCLWCPNKKFDRFSKDSIMDKDLYIKILKDLKDNHFDESYNENIEIQKTISFLGYQEPLLQPDIFKEYVHIAQDIIGYKVFLVSSTNGDFLTKENLNNLHLNNLCVMDYDNKGLDYWMNKMEELECPLIYPETPYETLTFIHDSVNTIQIHLNWPERQFIEDRGGSLNKNEMIEKGLKVRVKRRKKDCPEMSYYLNIAYNGLVMPCCNMRFDNPEHSNYILGDLKTQTLHEILTSDKYLKFKNILENKDNFIGFEKICTYCTKIKPMKLSGAPNGYQYSGGSYKI